MNRGVLAGSMAKMEAKRNNNNHTHIHNRKVQKSSKDKRQTEMFTSYVEVQKRNSIEN